MRVLSFHHARKVEHQQKCESTVETDVLARHALGHMRRHNRGWYREHGLTSSRADRARDEIGGHPHLVDDVERRLHRGRKMLDFPEPVADRIPTRKECGPDVASELPDTV